MIGSGGREHALCWKLAQNRDVRLTAAPGNPGMAQLGVCFGTQDYLAVAERFNADLTVVGPEQPLAAGIVDRFRSSRRAIVGPTAAAARLESSKAFAKAFMNRAGIPTARHIAVSNAAEARAALKQFPFPVVLKADGLAAGKGVVIAHNAAEAETALVSLLSGGSGLVLEEFLSGEEVSFIVLSDGQSVVPLEPSQDHKAAYDSDTGPNTGGMGAYSDGRILTTGEQSAVLDEVIMPAITQMRAEGEPFTGFLYAGLMMTDAGPRVLEFNCRLGDPETQALMHRMASDFVEPLAQAAHGSLSDTKIEWHAAPSVCVVLAAAGYPGNVRVGDEIAGVDEVHEGVVFQAGTAQQGKVLKTAGGRVLGVTASGADLRAAIDNTYAEVAKIHFDGVHYRKDIGAKGLRRW